MKLRYTCRKLFPEFPFAHRQPTHDGHCALIHGHNWDFAITFAADKLIPGSMFVVDFGKLKEVKAWLESKFDHTLVLNLDDPYLTYLKGVLVNSPESWEGGKDHPFAKIVEVPNCGAEGLCSYIMHALNEHFARVDLYGTDFKERGVQVIKVEVMENSRNSASLDLMPARPSEL